MNASNIHFTIFNFSRFQQLYQKMWTIPWIKWDNGKVLMMCWYIADPQYMVLFLLLLNSFVNCTVTPFPIGQAIECEISKPISGRWLLNRVRDYHTGQSILIVIRYGLRSLNIVKWNFCRKKLKRERSVS